MQIRKATRQKAKLRLGISGPSGSGKTITALLLAYGMIGDWSKIVVIDTESNSADLYANHTIISNGENFVIGEFMVLTLAAPYSTERCIEAIHMCEKAGFEFIIFDSISHEWNGAGGILEFVDKKKEASSSKNAFTNGWNEATPKHTKFVQTILNSSCHMIGTMRSKVEYVMETEERNGRSIQKPKKVGMAPIQREGMDYEFTIHLDLNVNCFATAQKDRSGLFKESEVITIKHGQLLKEWCELGIDIETEVKNRIGQLANVATLDELKDFGEGLPDIVKNDARFRASAIARKKEIESSTK